MLFQSFFLGSVLSLAVAAAVLGLAIRAVHRGQRGSWGGGVALAAGYGAGHLVLRGWPTMPAHERLDWLFYLAIAGGLLSVWQPRKDQLTAAWLLRGGLCLTAVCLLLRPMLAGLETSSGLAWVAGLSVAGCLWWWLLSRLAEGSAAPVWLAPAAISVAATALVTMLSGTAAVAQAQGLLLAAMLPLLALSWRGAQWSGLFHGSANVLAVLLPATWIVGHFYSDVPAEIAVLLWLTPLTAWVSRLPAVRRMRPWLAATLTIVVVASVAAVPVGITVIRFMREAPDRNNYGRDERGMQRSWQSAGLQQGCRIG